jgi:hypothetical protein
LRQGTASVDGAHAANDWSHIALLRGLLRRYKTVEQKVENLEFTHKSGAVDVSCFHNTHGLGDLLLNSHPLFTLDAVFEDGYILLRLSSGSQKLSFCKFQPINTRIGRGNGFSRAALLDRAEDRLLREKRVAQAAKLFNQSF